MGTASATLDDHDRHATHWVATFQNQIVGSVRVCIHESQDSLPDQKSLQSVKFPDFDKYANIGRLVVRAGEQHKGLGRLLVENAVAFAKRNPPVGICAISVPTVTAMAQNLGFAKLGDAVSDFVPSQKCSVMFSALKIAVSPKPSRA